MLETQVLKRPATDSDGETLILCAELPSGHSVTVEAYGASIRFGALSPARVNWSALGSSSIADAEAYAALLAKGAEEAGSLAQATKAPETDWDRLVGLLSSRGYDASLEYIGSGTVINVAFHEEGAEEWPKHWVWLGNGDEEACDGPWLWPDPTFVWVGGYAYRAGDKEAEVTVSDGVMVKAASGAAEDLVDAFVKSIEALRLLPADHLQ